jgi:magnesium transporter
MESIVLNNKNIGLPPGTPVYVGDRQAREMELSVIAFNADSAQIKTAAVEELSQFCADEKIWININGLRDIDSIKKLAKLYDIHSLTVEDILNTERQPKVEIFDNYRFISLKTIQREKTMLRPQEKKYFFARNGKKNQQEETDELLIDQISILVFANALITFQELSGDSFGSIRKRIHENSGQIRKMGIDYLAYSLIDAVVDEYFLALAHLENTIENFEERAIETNDDTFIVEIQDTKKYLLRIRRAILPLRDNLVAIARKEIPFLNETLKPFLQDLRENVHQALETVEHYREWLTNVMDVNLSVLSHQMNKVMKILAIISTIFIPLTFVAGIYGMNFDFMPELKSPLGYPIVLGSMTLIAFIMIMFFKRRRWL